MKSFSQLDPIELRTQLPRYAFQDPYLYDFGLIFNPNEYEKTMQTGINACTDRYMATLIYARSTIAEIHRHRKAGFPEDLAFINQSVPLKQAALCELTCPSIRANFESLIFATKSLLDVLCKYLLSNKIGQGIDGFHKCKIGGREVVGGRVLNLLKESVSLSKLPTRDYLINLLEQHKAKWIDDLVAMRDAVTHTGELLNIIGFWMVIESGREARYTMADVRDPMLRLRNKTDALEAYCEQLMNYVRDFTVSFRDALFPSEDRAATLAKLQSTSKRH